MVTCHSVLSTRLQFVIVPIGNSLSGKNAYVFPMDLVDLQKVASPTTYIWVSGTFLCLFTRQNRQSSVIVSMGGRLLRSRFMHTAQF